MAGFPDIPGYELQAELGRGGMAIVYSAIETNLGREVAIKVVTGLAGDPDGQIERLENEARGLAALHHPHIVDLYRFGRTTDGALYYVMPLLPGGSLEDWPKPVPEQRVIALLDDLLDALGHAHASDIVHRDIKPGNILFDRHDRPLLADFGAALMRRRSTRLTSHGAAIGSSGYMSPEQARGLAVDARSDLYSTAVLAFELLTGNRPFEGPDDLAIAIAQTEQPVPALPPSLRHWQPFFARALAVNPDQRFVNTAAMRSALRALKSASAVPAWRSPAVLAGVALAGVVLVGVAALAARGGQQRAGSETGDAAETRTKTAFPGPPSTPAGAVEDAARSGTSAVSRAPRVGDRFTDAGEPEMVLASEAEGSHPALAVMVAAVDTTLFQRYAKERGRAALKCADSASPAQGCLDLATAKDLARWLGKETAHEYRVPTRTELAAAMAHVAPAPAYAWTSTCNEVRVVIPRKAGSRAWSRVKKVFGGKPTPQRVETRCEGHFALKLDAHGAEARVREKSDPGSVVVLVREMPAPK